MDQPTGMMIDRNQPTPTYYSNYLESLPDVGQQVPLHHLQGRHPVRRPRRRRRPRGLGVQVRRKKQRAVVLLPEGVLQRSGQDGGRAAAPRALCMFTCVRV